MYSQNPEIAFFLGTRVVQNTSCSDRLVLRDKLPVTSPLSNPLPLFVSYFPQGKKKGRKMPKTGARAQQKAKGERKPIASEKTVKEVRSRRSDQQQLCFLHTCACMYMEELRTESGLTHKIDFTPNLRLLLKCVSGVICT